MVQAYHRFRDAGRDNNPYSTIKKATGAIEAKGKSEVLDYFRFPEPSQPLQQRPAWRPPMRPAATIRSSGATISAYHPTVRDRVATSLLGDARPDGLRGRLVNGFVGSTGLGHRGPGPLGTSIADYTPIGLMFGADEAGRDFAQGKWAQGALGLAAAVPIPMAAAARGAGKLAENGVVMAAKRKAELAARNPALDMSRAAQLERARALGYRVDEPVYHATASDFSAFDPAKRGASTGTETAKAGYWVSPNPHEIGEFYDWAGKQPTNAWPNTVPLLYRSQRQKAVVIPKGTPNQPRAGAALDAFGQGYDSVRMFHPEGHQTVVVKDPNQLRSIFAAFDPAKKTSSNLLAGLGGAGLVVGGLTTYDPPRDLRRGGR